MRASYMVSGIVLTIIGLVVLMGTGGFTFWAAGTTDGNQSGSASATLGLPSILGWAMFLIGIALIIIGAVADPYDRTYTSGGGRRKDITVVK